MTYNKSQIMKAAWTKYNNLKKMMLLSYYTLEDGKEVLHTVTFGDMLKEAWAEAKETAAANHRITPRNAAIDREIFFLNMKDRWSQEDFDRSRQLHQGIVA